MCLILKVNEELGIDTNLHYATEDIVCYKYLKDDMKSPFRDFQWGMNKEVKANVSKTTGGLFSLDEKIWLTHYVHTPSGAVNKPATCEESTNQRARAIKSFKFYYGNNGIRDEVNEGLYSYPINYNFLKFDTCYQRCFKCIIPKHTWYYKGITNLIFQDIDKLVTRKSVPTYVSERLILTEEVPLNNR